MIGTLADFRAFHTERGNAAPAAASDADATSALVRGSDYVRRAFCLVVEETDERVIEAAYAASGFELPAPGFWVSQDSGKVLTQVGEIGWTLREADGPKPDAMTPRELITAILGAAAESRSGIKAMLRA